MNLGMMATYDAVQGSLQAKLGCGLCTNLLSSAAAGVACAFTSLPFDMIKSRLMNMRVDAAGNMPYAGFVDCVTKVLHNEGVAALWRGYFTYYARCAPNAMIVLLTAEQLNQMYRKAFLTSQGVVVSSGSTTALTIASALPASPAARS